MQFECLVETLSNGLKSIMYYLPNLFFLHCKKKNLAITEKGKGPCKYDAYETT